MGSRKTGSGVENVYAAAEKWVDCALRSDDSLFTPGKPIWTSQRLGKLRERFLDKHDDWTSMTSGRDHASLKSWNRC